MIRKNIGKNEAVSPPESAYKHSKPPTRTLKRRYKYLIPEEIDALLNCITNLRDRAIFRLAYHHGLRASEVGKISMADYHVGKTKEATQDRLVIERLKGSIGGDTRLVPAAAVAIRHWVKKRGYAPGPLFVTREGTPIGQRRLDVLMKRYCGMVGIPREKAHFHTLKHTCATIMLSVRKESIVDVKNHLGHADIRSTMIYAELTEQANEERAQRLKNWR